jgi:hypothetical protein
MVLGLLLAVVAIAKLNPKETANAISLDLQASGNGSSTDDGGNDTNGKA